MLLSLKYSEISSTFGVEASCAHTLHSAHDMLVHAAGRCYRVAYMRTFCCEGQGGPSTFAVSINAGYAHMYSHTKRCESKSNRPRGGEICVAFAPSPVVQYYVKYNALRNTMFRRLLREHDQRVPAHATCSKHSTHSCLVVNPST